MKTFLAKTKLKIQLIFLVLTNRRYPMIIMGLPEKDKQALLSDEKAELNVWYFNTDRNVLNIIIGRLNEANKTIENQS